VLAALSDWARSGVLWDDLVISVWRAWVGLLIGATSGVAVGVLTGRSRVLGSLLVPVLTPVRALPPVSLIPLFIIFVGIDTTGKIAVIAFSVFFPVWTNTHIGASNLPTAYFKAAHSLGLGRLRIMLRIVLPATVPSMLAGIRLGAAVSFIMLYVSELSGASAGIGYRVSVSHLSYQIDLMLASLAVLGALAAATDMMIVLISRWLFPWMERTR